MGDELHSSTGFLIGPDVVLASFHAVQSIVDGVVDHRSLCLQFEATSSNDAAATACYLIRGKDR